MLKKISESLNSFEPDDANSRLQLTYMMVNDRRFKMTGVGHFSNFYEHDDFPNIGFKIGTKVEDSASAYTAWCREHQGEAGVPTIYGVRKANNGMFVVAVEKYNRVTGNEESFRLFQCLNSNMSFNDVEGVIRDDIYSFISNKSRDDDSIKSYNYMVANKRFVYKYCKTIIAIAKYFKDLAQFDMHKDNWCYDNNGYPVIIDPTSFRRKIIE